MQQPQTPGELSAPPHSGIGGNAHAGVGVGVGDVTGVGLGEVPGMGVGPIGDGVGLTEVLPSVPGGTASLELDAELNLAPPVESLQPMVKMAIAITVTSDENFILYYRLAD